MYIIKTFVLIIPAHFNTRTRACTQIKKCKKKRHTQASFFFAFFHFRTPVCLQKNSIFYSKISKKQHLFLFLFHVKNSSAAANSPISIPKQEININHTHSNIPPKLFLIKKSSSLNSKLFFYIKYFMLFNFVSANPTQTYNICSPLSFNHHSHPLRAKKTHSF